jgi:glyoxylase-like metal-dependent hydrolase (beta-lactamase superfamily II)
MQRRDFIKLTAAAIAANSVGGLRATADAAQQPVSTSRNPVVYRFSIGDIEAISISEGHMFFRNPLNLMYPEDQRPVMKQALENESERTDGLPLYINILALKIGNEVALFDSGFGVGKDPMHGWMNDGLAAAGIRPEQITTAFLSHAHVDHICGFIAGNKPAFPNAAIYVLKDEVDFWHQNEPDFSESHRSKAELPNLIRDNRARFEILKPNLQKVADGTKVHGDRIAIEATPGHTIGHAAFRIASKGESLLHITDAAHHHILMFANPEWTIGFDHHLKMAVATRKKMFEKESAERTRLYGFHLPWPGLGRVVKNGDGYRWLIERTSWGY